MEAFKLNPQQQEAVETIEGSLLLLAGAGTGKTRVIVQRIVQMYREGISPRNILAVTFTNKAAKEMKERVIKALPSGIHKEELPTISTFHSFCAVILRQFASYLGYDRNFTLATEGYQNGLLREVATEIGEASESVDPFTWLSMISRAKSAMISPEEMMESDPRVGKIYQRYDQRLKAMNMMDFDDILLRVVELWEKYPKILVAYQERYPYLMIDEYQDTNRVQLKIMVLLAGEKANLFAVGDDDQSIYGWRGADQQNILEFTRYFPKARILRLEQNYRSTNTILKAANGIIAHNKNRHEKRLWSAGKEGEKLLGVRCEDSQAEADFVADNIFNLASEGGSLLNNRAKDWRQYAVLYRASAQSRLLEEALRKRHIPYEVVGSKGFYERKEILDLITMLELAANPKSDTGLLRVINVPPRGIGDSSIAKLTEIHRVRQQPLFQLIADPSFTSQISAGAAEKIRQFHQAILEVAQKANTPGSLENLVQKLVDQIQYTESLLLMYKPRTDALARRENVMEFLNALREYDAEKKYKATLTEYLQMLQLRDAQDRNQKDKGIGENVVSLMTIHAAKGLEFPQVYLVGMEQGQFPHQMALEEGNLEEERRLCYVAVTRAKENLTISYAGKRKVQGRIAVHRPSLFLDEIPEELIEFTTPAQLNHPMTEEEEDAAFEEVMKRLQAEKDSLDSSN